MASPIHDEGVEDIRPITTIHTFDTNYFVENIAVRPSGQILVTVHNTSELIQIDPHTKSPPKVIHKFAENASGIVEVSPDIFYVSTGTIGQAGSYAIYKVDMSTSPSPTVSKAVDVPEAIFLNGSALLNGDKGIFLAADSLLGAVFAIDTLASPPSMKKWLQDPALTKTTSDPATPGVNGIKLFDGHLFLSNTDAKKFLKIPVTSSGEAGDSIEKVIEKCNIDDFVIDAEGNAYVTTHIFNSVLKISKDGTRSRIAGGPEDALVAGTTAVAFGRTEGDKQTLYVTTNGGMSNPVKGKVGPARLLAVAL